MSCSPKQNGLMLFQRYSGSGSWASELSALMQYKVKGQIPVAMQACMYMEVWMRVRPVCPGTGGKAV